MASLTDAMLMTPDDANPRALVRLLDGVRRFRQEVYPEREEIYRKAAGQVQQPHTLFITCADSRIGPEMITQSGPGEIFVCRNIGNIVPAHGETPGGVSAVLEFAVAALGVEQIVICGHTDCGAMKALLQHETLASLPIVKRWLRNAEAALAVTRKTENNDGELGLLNQLIEQNVLLQMAHVRTHPSVARRLALRNLAIYGWVYDIGNGDVRIHDSRIDRFIPVDEFDISEVGAVG